MKELKMEGGDKKRSFDRRMFLRKTLPVVAAMPLLIGCKVESSQNDIMVDKVNNIIAEYEINNPRSFNSVVSKLERLSADPVSDLEKLLKVQDIGSRYNIYFALMLIGEKSEQQRQEIMSKIEPGLEDEAAHISGIIANYFIYYGDKRGVPVLIDKLDDKYNKVYMLSEPPLPLPVYSLKTLKRYTGQDFGNDTNAWESWWQKNEEKINWDPKIKRFK